MQQISLLDKDDSNLGSVDLGSNLPIIIRGRSFSQSDIEFISRCITEYSKRGRTYISQIICEEFDWRQPNGWLKDRACRDALLKLEERGFLTLPARLTPEKHVKDVTTDLNSLAGYDISTTITQYPTKISLEFAKGNKTEIIWNELVQKFHYLGHKVIVGRCIKYVVKSENTLLGAIAFSSPAWRLDRRDSLLDVLGIDKGLNLDYIINNSRFLILPNVRVPNLASTILSLATKRIVADWTKYYAVTPQIAETFVQPSRFLGTCYKAANWVEIGLTKGYAKRGQTHHNSQEPKQIYLYGLSKATQRKLLKLKLSNGKGE